jgi:hypothetical protein
LILIAETIIAFEQDDLADPTQSKPLLIEGQQSIFARNRILHDHVRRLSLSLDLKKDHSAAILQQEDRRQRRAHLHQIAKTEPRRKRPHAIGARYVDQLVRRELAWGEAVITA